METYLRGIAAAVGRRPAAVIVISAHWEAARPTLNVGERPALLFDYYGFPSHTYQLTYPAPGSPALARRVGALLDRAGIAWSTDAERGFDHGVFVPFKLIYPDADVPVLQLSMQAGLDPAAHLALGAALAPLRDEDVLVVGSGMSYHNLRQLFDRDPASAALAEQFDRWLADAVSAPDAAERAHRLADWQGAPGARASHPRPDHLLPLMVAAGAAGTDPGRRTFHDRLLGKPVAGFQFG